MARIVGYDRKWIDNGDVLRHVMTVLGYVRGQHDEEFDTQNEVWKSNNKCEVDKTYEDVKRIAERYNSQDGNTYERAVFVEEVE